jgi:hypothetical protein
MNEAMPNFWGSAEKMPEMIADSLWSMNHNQNPRPAEGRCQVHRPFAREITFFLLSLMAQTRSGETKHP